MSLRALAAGQLRMAAHIKILQKDEIGMDHAIHFVVAQQLLQAFLNPLQQPPEIDRRHRAEAGGTRSFQLTEGGPLLRVGGVLIHGAVEQLLHPGDAIGEIDLILRLLEESRLWIDAKLIVQHPRQHRPNVVRPDVLLPSEPRQRLGEVQQRLDGAGGDPILGLSTQVSRLVERAVLGTHLGDSAAGQVQRVLRTQFQAVGRPQAEIDLAKKEAEQLADGQRDRDCPHLAIRLVQFLRRADQIPRDELLGRDASGHTLGQGVEEARVERRAADNKVDPVAQRFDHGKGAAALLVVGGQIPGGAP